MPIDAEEFRTPTSTVCQGIFLIWSMDSFVFSTLNKASQFADDSKVANMGPFAVGIDEAVAGAATRRIDVDKRKYSNCDVWRGTGMDEEEISEF